MIWAKFDKEGNPTESLQHHTEKVMAVCEKMDFPTEVIEAAKYHDIGKGHYSWQENRSEYRYRHEIFSASIFLRNFNHKDRVKIFLLILFHHKYFGIIDLNSDSSSLLTDFEYLPTTPRRVRNSRFEKIKDKTMWDELENYFGEKLDKDIQNPLKTILELQDDLKKGAYGIESIIKTGQLKYADYLASGGLLPITLDSYPDLSKYAYKTQIQSYDCQNNMILIAPTGSGKTEAVLRWASKFNFKRLFYVLPYTASINKMYGRLSEEIFGEGNVGLNHSKAMSFYMNTFGDEGRSKLEKKKSKMNCFPVTVTTPFQIMRYFFGIKHYEVGFAQLKDAGIIIDEIHVYDPRTLGNLLAVLKYCSENLGLRFAITTATFPDSVLRLFYSYLKGIEINEIRVADHELKNIFRHKVKILKGDLINYVDRVKKLLSEGKRVLCVFNSVAAAVLFYTKFDNYNNKALLHSRFTAADRIKQEDKIADCQLLIGTQAIEVSLNISFDTLFSQAAPIDDLLQRLGRANRDGEKPPVNIYICSEIDKTTSKIYGRDICEKTIDELRNIDNLTELDAKNLTNIVYSEFSQTYLEDLEKYFNAFYGIMADLKPFYYNSVGEKEYSDMFDGIQIIPAWHSEKVLGLHEEGKYVEAESYFVSVGNWFYKANSENIEWHDKGFYVAHLIYNSEIGLTSEVEKRYKKVNIMV